MNKSKWIKIRVISFLTFLFIILFANNSYCIYDNKTKREVIIGGELLEIDMKCSKLMFFCYDDNNLKLKNYDLIQSIEGDVIKNAFNKNIIKDIKRKDILKIILNMQNDENVKVNIIRNNKLETLILKKNDINHSYFTEEINISGSLTYIDPDNNTFGCVAHNLDLNGNKNIVLQNGEIYSCNLKNVTKSNTSEVGNMYGEKASKVQGYISSTNNFGAKGKISNNDLLKNAQIYTVGSKENIKLGSATILIKDDKDSKKEGYEINIIKINKQDEPQTCGFEFEIVDKDMIQNYGGIVQGMSGCPIIQNGKLIGALSHVVSNNPKHGMGLYIDWMMED